MLDTLRSIRFAVFSNNGCGIWFKFFSLRSELRVVIIDEVVFRVFLTAVHLPGESQIIDRVFDRFSLAFYNKYKPPDFANHEAVHILSYAWLMLHTSLHNAQVTEKQTEETFKNMLKGQNGDKDFNEDFLKEIFNSVKEYEVPLSLNLQMKTHQYWILQEIRNKLINLRVNTGHEVGITAALFERTWKVAGPVFTELFERGNKGAMSSFEGSVMIASTFHETHIIDNVVKTFCAFATSSMNSERDARALSFIFRMCYSYGSDISDWTPIINVLLRLFMGELLPLEMCQEVSIEDSSKILTFSIDMFNARKNSTNEQNGSPKLRNRAHSSVSISKPV